MMKNSRKILIDIDTPKDTTQKFTNNTKVIFQVVLGKSLKKDYDFPGIENDKKAKEKLIKFLANYLNKPINKLEKECRSKDYEKDRDEESGKQIIHYRLSHEFRLHGYYSNELFHVVRIDPNHKFNGKR